MTLGEMKRLIVEAGFTPQRRDTRFCVPSGVLSSTGKGRAAMSVRRNWFLSRSVPLFTLYSMTRASHSLIHVLALCGGFTNASG